MSENCTGNKYYTRLTEVLIDNFIPAYRGKDKNVWVDQKEAMGTMKISSTTTLQVYRDKNKILYSELSARKIIYHKESIIKLIESKSNIKEYGRK